MIRNYLKVALRNLWRNKFFSIINISGLVIGMASAMLILSWIQNELGYDRFHTNGNNLYKVYNRDVFDNKLQCWPTTPKILAPTIKDEYPEVQDITRVNWPQTYLFSIGNKRLKSTGTMTDPAFLTMFSFPLVEGQKETALGNLNSIVITQKLEKKLFGNADGIGKTVQVDNKDYFTVSGILKDFPNNTRFKDDEFLLPWSYMRRINQDDSSWGNNSTASYILLKPGTDIAAFNAKIKNITIRHSNEDDKTQVFLYPVSMLHLYDNFVNGEPSGGQIVVVRIFLLIAILILLIACINFMNLSTARSEKRAKEVGIRKVVGAHKKSLVGQFIGESILIAFIAGILAIVVVQLAIPSFNTLTQKQLFIDYGNIDFWMAALGFILFTGVLAGSYPAFYLSSFRPVGILKGVFKAQHALITPRKALVILQFTFAIVLIISTIVIEKQIKYAQERETGYSRDNLIYVPLEGDIEKNYTLIKNDLINKNVATSVTKTSSPLTESYSDSWGFSWPGKDPNAKIDFNRFTSSGDLIKTSGMQIVAGRDIDLKNYPTDSTACLLNEAAVKVINLKNPVGQVIKDGDNDINIVGVVKDFILQSPYDAVQPMIIEGPKHGFYNVVNIKLNSNNSTAKNLDAAKKIFNRYNLQYPFEFHFMDEEYAQKFSNEELTGTLAALFAGLTIFISCLGLFGLAAYMAENRIKEIGVRKVLGASVTNITALLSKDFIKLVMIAVFIAVPIAWFAMNKWLGNFDYKVTINLWVFLTAGIAAILIALFTISFQAIKAAIANPVKSLRTE